jgi:hypothetical protein
MSLDPSSINSILRSNMKAALIAMITATLLKHSVWIDCLDAN